jgi:hypothetical protein
MMKNWDLEYYIMPDEYIGFDKHQKQIRNIDLTDWKMIHIGPSNKFSRRWNAPFFVEDVEFMSKLLVDFKSADEQLIVSICESWRKNIFRERELLNMDDIREEVPECFGGKGAFVYQREDEISKFIFINQGETLECYFREQHLEHMLEKISKVATITDYRKYELGE